MTCRKEGLFKNIIWAALCTLKIFRYSPEFCKIICDVLDTFVNKVLHFYLYGLDHLTVERGCQIWKKIMHVGWAAKGMLL